jgi:hypothetical protein
MDITKRRLLAAGGLGVLVGGGTGAKGAEINPSAPGFTIMVSKHHGVWSVIVPDLNDETYTGKYPETYIQPVKWMPLVEWLKTMDGDVQP